ncbi:MAG: hypothetical protein A2571_01590 [Candidatus Vogelbacteria bacterium RIFOXYD1_FULL_44_32]|uniref:Uncharacterized protein n=1 Tax=Candidatus Vogelbacteria bacterium RIFOXYD1_FULL_44_32 TaxID=1802438 RepID=A0A1G2QCZ1_9BACT|nr:MAG: hypothetical protein A2571_01590 [Candidatus Vogelbacteria bacterium RIFOXYD1_FULL_44_32]
MGSLSRQPNSNESTPAPMTNPWAPADTMFALLSKGAVRCCVCYRPTAKEHVTVKGEHVFCPDHCDEECCEPAEFDHHYNVKGYLDYHSSR